MRLQLILEWLHFFSEINITPSVTVLTLCCFDLCKNESPPPPRHGGQDGLRVLSSMRLRFLGGFIDVNLLETQSQWVGGGCCWPSFWCSVHICPKHKISGWVGDVSFWCSVHICPKPKVSGWVGDVVDPAFDVQSTSVQNPKSVGGWGMLLTQLLMFSPHLAKTQSQWTGGGCWLASKVGLSIASWINDTTPPPPHWTLSFRPI